MSAIIKQINGWSVATDDDEPRIRDIELGERLGFARPAKIRDLIKRLARLGKLKDVRCIPTVGRQQTGLGRTRALVVNEFWLTQRQALKVILKSETAIADQIQEEVIDVFEAYLGGQLVAPAEPQQVAIPVLPNSPTLGDQLYRGDVEDLCVKAVRRTGASIHRIHGRLKILYGASGVYRISGVHYEEVCRRLRAWARARRLPALMPRRLLKPAADSVQCVFAFMAVYP